MTQNFNNLAELKNMTLGLDEAEEREVSIDNNKLYKPKSFSNIHCFGGYK